MLAIPVREVKRRVNTCLYPSTLDKMDACARRLRCSRSELLEYCFTYWYDTAYRFGGVSDGRQN